MTLWGNHTSHLNIISNAPMKDEQRISLKYLYMMGLFISPEVTLLNMYYQNKQHFIMHKRI